MSIVAPGWPPAMACLGFAAEACAPAEVDMATVALLGTGLLGSGFAEALLRNGHAVRVWNRTAAKAAPLVALGATLAETPAEAVDGAERVHLVLAEDTAVDATIAALRSGLGAGVPIVDHSTNQPGSVAARFAALRAEGVRYLHAPVFMGPQAARDATGLMLIAGPKDDVDGLSGALATMTGKVWFVGERPDLAAAHKLFGNATLIAMTAAVGDLLVMGQRLDLPTEQVLALFEVFKPAGMLTFYGRRIAAAGQTPASFELDMARKDVRLAIETAGGPADLVALPAVAAAMDRAIAAGHGAEDFAVFASPAFRG